ncbi:hypothetical protein SAMN04489859_102031 [Paracoccus alcaliphilus]|uniref:Uncharacterized protein n=1 Tax=Paracoccus alcaliphilus TaxID=34002 RepID=A0A1H8K4I4_9RHOB|nr:hypothetical protein [Paracoccus alcaliphilus]WCR17528.1 hypothetical protein JHW40_14490 [Paracoccus alcaliphilus]SEN87406.1 hypothetical protein SAMN04489859_102031 [Paracoccus alcaliphilus]
MTILQPVLRGRYPSSKTEADEARRAIQPLSQPADPLWIGQRVVTLLYHYFAADIAPAAIEAMAEDWITELREYPAWAIEAACKAWLSKDNPKRGKKPMPGDISEGADKSAALITSARQMIKFYEKYGDQPPAYLKS